MSRLQPRAFLQWAHRLHPLWFATLPLDPQYRQPRGSKGWQVGLSMADQHHPETRWTASLLPVEPHHQLLELGCGPGVLLELLAARVPAGKVQGLDFSRVMVHMASGRCQPLIEQGRIEVHHGDVSSLPFEDHSFDGVVSVHSLYFWPDPVQALQEALRVLRPAGHLLMTLMPREKWPNQGEGSPCNVYSGEELQQLLLEVGFSQARVIPGDPAQFRELAVLARK